MDLPLFNVLDKSGYLVYLGYFAVNNWTRDRLLKAKDLKKVMEEILPKKIARRDGIIDEIITELKNPDHDFQPAVKKEEELQITTSNMAEDDVLLIEANVEIITVEDDDEVDTDRQLHVADAVIAPSSVPSKIFSSWQGVRAMLLSPDNPDQSQAQGGGASPKRAKPSDMTDTLPSLEFETFTEKKIIRLMALLDSKLSDGDANSTKSWSDWTQIYSEEGHNIDLLVCKSWTWKPIAEECPLNLLHILTNVCPQVEELYIKAECNFMATPLAVNPTLELKNLNILVINHDNHNGLLEYHEILAAIITAAGGNLKEIAFLYQDDVALKRFLDILTNLRREYLANLIYLRIARWDDWHIALLEKDLYSLAGINTDHLIYLDLQLGFWDNVQSPFEKMLRKFVDLHYLSIHGCFVTGTNAAEPQITIDFPHMRNLKELSIGQSYVFSTTFEDTCTRPAKRRDRSLRVHEERTNGTGNRLGKQNKFS